MDRPAAESAHAPNTDATHARWIEGARIDRLGGGLLVARLNLTLNTDEFFGVSGPPVFSVSIHLYGEATYWVENGAPLVARAGSVIVFESAAATKGQNRMRAGAELDIVSIRIQHGMMDGLDPSQEWPRVNSLRSRRRMGAADEVDCSVPERNAYMIGFPAPAPLLEVARQIAHCNFRDGAIRQIYLRGKSLEAIALTLSELNGLLGGSASRNPREQRKIAAAIALMTKRYEENWTSARLAQAVGMSEKKLQAAFRDIVGRPVHAYLRKIRIDAAAGRLRDGCSVTEAALLSGFGNLSHFSKSFREAKGVPPGLFRKSRDP